MGKLQTATAERLYRVVLLSGLLSTGWGRDLFEGLYQAYKR